MANGKEGREKRESGTWGCMTNDMPEKSFREKIYFSIPLNVVFADHTISGLSLQQSFKIYQVLKYLACQFLLVLNRF